MRGRAFASIALLCGTWVAARIAFTTMDIRAVSQNGHGTYPHSVSMGSVPKLPRAQTVTRQSPRHSVAAHAVLHAQNSPTKIAVEPEGTAPLFFSADTHLRITPAAFLATDADAATPIDALRPNAQAPQRFEVYAYSYWRRGTSPAGTLGNGQYGGSQSAVIAAIPVLRFSGNPSLSRLSLTGRASVAHGSLRERELAAGVRWRPVARIPVQIIAELDGERVLRTDVHCGYLHRGFEKECEDHTWHNLIPYVDRLNYCSALINDFSYCDAVEQMMGIEITPRTKYLRTLLSEYMRITDHLTCIAASLMELGAMTAFLYLVTVRDYMYEHLAALTGARVTYSYGRIGGLANDVLYVVGWPPMIGARIGARGSNTGLHT